MDYTLTTERLRLRLMEVDDAERIFRGYSSDPEASRFMTFPTQTDVAETRAFLEGRQHEFAAGKSVLWAICSRNDDDFIGAIEIRPEEDDAEVGFIIARPYWGRGIVAEALSAVLQFAKGVLRLERVHGRCDVENLQSARVFEKSGFACAGVAPKSVVHPNVSSEPRDARLFTLDL
ncbi:MAG TPA: GNAT family N-acetyltransferase [Candidatus Cybelea sp.]|jgi:ribosomal-protein-alanine N-acetyltransferase|nr:GNAT family N-acetyltransferase [Candidatus Cybelea sp.]